MYIHSDITFEKTPTKSTQTQKQMFYICIYTTIHHIYTHTNQCHTDTQMNYIYTHTHHLSRQYQRARCRPTNSSMHTDTQMYFSHKNTHHCSQQ